MEILFNDLLKELNKEYPKPVPLRILNKEHDAVVIRDAIKNHLVEMDTIPVLDEYGTPVKNNREGALRISFEGLNFLKRNENSNKSRHSGNTKIIKNVTIVKDSKGIVAQTGNTDSNATQNIGNQQVIQTLPYTSNENVLIRIGRWMMEKFFGSLDHSISPFVIAVSILSLLTGSPLVYAYYNSLQEKTLFIFSPLIVYDFIAFFLVIIFGWGLVLMAQETICPNCKKKFAFTRKSRTLENRIDLPEKEVRNYKNSYSCDFCGFTKSNVPEIVEIEKSSK